jgi:hypothetical protein
MERFKREKECHEVPKKQPSTHFKLRVLGDASCMQMT